MPYWDSVLHNKRKLHRKMQGRKIQEVEEAVVVLEEEEEEEVVAAAETLEIAL